MEATCIAAGEVSSSRAGYSACIVKCSGMDNPQPQVFVLFPGSYIMPSAFLLAGKALLGDAPDLIYIRHRHKYNMVLQELTN